MVDDITKLNIRVNQLETNINSIIDDNKALHNYNKALQLQIHKLCNTHNVNNPGRNSDKIDDIPAIVTRKVTQQPVETEQHSSTESGDKHKDSHSSSDCRDDDSDFEYKRQYRKRLTKLQKRKINIVKDNSPTTQIEKPIRKKTANIIPPVHIANTEKEIELYIGKVGPHHTEVQIKRHISNMGVRVISIKTLRNQPDWNSFSVKIDDKHRKTVLNQNKWSSGIIVQPFRKVRPRQRNPLQSRDIAAARQISTLQGIWAEYSSSMYNSFDANYKTTLRHNICGEK